ncbi:MAG: protein translocase subunit SecD [Treponema sp.]|nr:protein translocase subunit SecD [Treponema sp.]MCL2237350.1 protein translocase subunit SecD [Treponema sp.]
MNKRYRFFILLVVLGLSFLFLWPTIRWYFFIPKEQQALALETRQQISENARYAAQIDLQRLIEAVRADEAVPEGLEFITVLARNEYRKNKLPIPEQWTARNVLEAFDNRRQALDAIEQKYADEIFALKDMQRNAVKLGLDLSGGLSIVLQANMEALSQRMGRSLNDEDRVDAVNRALEVLNSRIDRFGLTEPVIRRQGTSQIYIEIPGTADPERINDIIMGKGSLTFHLQDVDATNAFYQYYRMNPTGTFDSNGNLLIEGLIPPSTMVLGIYEKDKYGLDIQKRDLNGLPEYIVINREVGLDGNYIIDAMVDRDGMSGQPIVAFQLSSEGGEIFYRLTSANVNKPLAIVLDDKVKSSPNITTGIRERGTISGFNQEEAENLALVLRTAALPVELEVANQQSIGASLGADTIRQGLYALLGGVALVLLFMLIYYRSAGINAVVAQLLNFYIMFSVLSALNFTLTLPAIAGFILTIGMATDANVIIFERMKEEMRLGKSRKAVVEAGFGKAFWAIMDSNITTFIAALFLSQLGSGPIRGFAVSLSIGVFSSVFTALFVSRLIFDFGTDVMRSKGLSVSWTTRIQDTGAKAAAKAVRI